MGVHSGKNAVINGQSTVRNWQINDLSTPVAYVASNTRRGTGRRPGIRDWNGSFNGYGGNPLTLPGDTFSFQGYTAPGSVDSSFANTGEVYQGPAIVDSVTINWDWATAAIINWSLAFSGNGPLVPSSGFFSDDSSPDVPSSTLAKITVDNFGAFGSGSAGSTAGENEICAGSASLTFTAANVPYVNSCTGGWTYRRSGPIDWTGSIVVQDNSRDLGYGQEFNIGDDLLMRWYVSPEEYWRLKWAHVKDYSNLNVDVESGAIITQTINLEMNGFNPDGDSTGHIIAPGAIDPYWPEVFSV